MAVGPPACPYPGRTASSGLALVIMERVRSTAAIGSISRPRTRCGGRLRPNASRLPNRVYFKEISTIANNIVAVAIRCQDGRTVLLCPLEQAAQQMQLFKRIAGVDTALGTNYSTTWAVGALKRIELNATGSSLTVYIDGTSPITATDSAITGVGRPALATPAAWYRPAGPVFRSSICSASANLPQNMGGRDDQRAGAQCVAGGVGSLAPR